MIQMLSSFLKKFIWKQSDSSARPACPPPARHHSSCCAQQRTHSQPQCPPRVSMAVFIHLLVLPVITVTTLNSCIFLGYAVQGEVGLPGDPGQPMVNGAVEFLGFPKGHKGIQVCCQNGKSDISAAGSAQTKSVPRLYTNNPVNSNLTCAVSNQRMRHTAPQCELQPQPPS